MSGAKPYIGLRSDLVSLELIHAALQHKELDTASKKQVAALIKSINLRRHNEQPR